jgi:predicted PurR-regulated permease PerM
MLSRRGIFPPPPFERSAILPEMSLPPEATRYRLQAALWIALGIGLIWLLSLLGPVLTPFLLAAILAYICSPAVDRLEKLRLPRLLAVVLILLLLVAVLAALALILVPLLGQETAILSSRLPDWLSALNSRLTPWLSQHLGTGLEFDAAALKRMLSENSGSLQGLGNKLLESLRIGGAALTGLLINLVLVPVVMFYLLLDWRRLVAWLDNAVPRAWHAKVATMARDVDTVLSGFLRGQLLVMLVLACYYSIALSIAGLPSAVTIGILTGLLIFIPYLGFATGLVVALLVATLQFAGLGPLIAVAIVFGIGQVLEGFMLTPFLVGSRIGLHPLAVIFALMAFGQLFGFFGILLALPASAALLVGLRELRTLYLGSHFYHGGGGA